MVPIVLRRGCRARLIASFCRGHPLSGPERVRDSTHRSTVALGERSEETCRYRLRWSHRVISASLTTGPIGSVTVHLR